MFIRSQLPVKKQLMRLRNSVGKIVENDLRICEELNSKFKNVFIVQYSPKTNDMEWREGFGNQWDVCKRYQ